MTMITKDYLWHGWLGRYMMNIINRIVKNPGVGGWKDLRGIVPSGTGAEKPAHRLTELFSTYVSFDELQLSTENQT